MCPFPVFLRSKKHLSNGTVRHIEVFGFDLEERERECVLVSVCDPYNLRGGLSVKIQFALLVSNNLNKDFLCLHCCVYI